MSFRDALSQYIEHPLEHEEVLFHDENVVIIRDKFPKSVRHYLVIPRSKLITHNHPLDAFNKNYEDMHGDELYELLEGYVEKAKDLIIEDLRSVLSEFTDIRASEFKNSFIQAGVHSIPSLRNLHFHVLTKDFHSNRLKNKKHYNSFASNFFVDFDQLNPILNEKYNKLVSQNTDYDSGSANDSDSDDSIEYVRNVRNVSVLEGYLKSNLKCLHCGANFDNSMVKLKEHLKKHFEIKFEQFGKFSRLIPNGTNTV